MKFKYNFGGNWLVVGLMLSMLFGASAAWAGPKVEVCHVPPGNPANFHTITVSENAVGAHLAHGDLEGACNQLCATLCDDGNACTVDDNVTDCEQQGCPSNPEPVDCNDGLACTTDSCEVTDGCQYAPAACGILVDFGKVSFISDPNGSVRWNDVATVLNNTAIPNPMIANAIDRDGNPTGISMSASSPNGPPTDYGIAAVDYTVPTSTGYPQTATRDSMYLDGRHHTEGVTVTLDGLHDALNCDLTFFNGHPQARIAVWEIDGIAQSLVLQGNTADVVVFEDIVPAEGEIEILYYAGSGSFAMQANWSTLELVCDP